MKQKKLTFLEALMLVAGAGIGTGILTIPYAVNRIGVFGTLVALGGAYAVSLVLYLMLADLTLHSQSGGSLFGILREHLFVGKYKKLLSVVFFAILVLLLLENLVVYILCASEVLTDLLGLSPWAAKVIFYLLASVVILFGIKGIGIGETYSVALIGAVVIALMFPAFTHLRHPLELTFGEPSAVFAVYGLFMFAFSAIFSVIQVCNHIERRENAGKAIIGGLTLNAVLTVAFAAAAILGSETVTEVATIGLSESLDLPAVKVICSLLVLLAMFSSYWSSGLAFAEVVEEQFHLSRRWAWLVSTVPTVLIAVLLPLTVLDYVQIGAGALSVILVIVVLPAYRHAVKTSDRPLLLGRAGKSRTLLYAIGFCILLMAVSSLIPLS